MQTRLMATGGVLALALALSACGAPNEDAAAPDAPEAAEPAPADAPDAPPPAEEDEAATTGSLEWAAMGEWRSDEDKARNDARNPVETLTFFGIEPDDTVVELWPGGGWYSNVLAPYLAAGGGQLLAAGWDADAFEGERAERIRTRMQEYADFYAADPDLYGTLEITAFSDQSEAFAPEGSADAVLVFRNVHSFLGQGVLDKFMTDAFAALKPGGTLGVVQHRLPSTAEQDPVAATGYVHEDVVKAAAERAGFEFAESSEINANPADTADHPFGVWTLPPVSRTTDRDGNTPEGFDAEAYLAIGESDRMTLKFTKPE